ncbi:hypothetical protein AGMMS50276_02710 [Synergistales bacterium]|nr:hypothetical protein AGMMS50276_02710 [Synergistales bacterium]
MKKLVALFWVLVLGLFVVNVAAEAEIKPSTTTATRDIVLVEDEDDEEGKDEAEVQAAVLDIEELHKNDFDVSLTSDKEIYNIGDSIVMTFKSTESAYLTILDFTASGQMIVLFPNKWVSDNHVDAGQEIIIPDKGQKFKMRAGGPVGVDVVKAIATNNNTQIVDPANESLVGPFAVLKDAKAATRDILLVEEDDEEEGNSASEGAKDSGALKWSVASLALATVDPSKADQPSGVVVASEGDWNVKMWTNGASFLTGEQVFVKFLSNKPAKLISLVNEGSGTRSLLPDGTQRSVQAGDIVILPGKNDKWKLVATSKAPKDIVKAKLVADDGTELELTLEVAIED